MLSNRKLALAAGLTSLGLGISAPALANPDDDSAPTIVVTGDASKPPHVDLSRLPAQTRDRCPPRRAIAQTCDRRGSDRTIDR